MAWTRPKTWSSEPLTSLDLNTYMRDNQNHLKDRLDNSANRVISAGSNLSTTSAAWVDVDTSELTLTLDTVGGDVLVGFAGSLRISRDNYRVYFNVAVDGVDHFADDGVTPYQSGNQDANRSKPQCIVVLIPNLVAGGHTFALRWQAQNGCTVYMEATNTHPQFWAKEL